jgi:Pyruvate/2-oxoacid:ferredoxin oxidoreductase gamma subunit
VTASAQAVAAAAAACPGVVRLSSGSAVEIATYLPGRRVHGVRIRGGVVEVHIVAAPDRNLPELAETVRAAVVGVADGRAVDVYVDDLGEPTDDDEATGDDTSAADVEPADRVRS